MMSFELEYYLLKVPSGNVSEICAGVLLVAA